jgi:hypothetical protein
VSYDGCLNIADGDWQKLSLLAISEEFYPSQPTDITRLVIANWPKYMHLIYGFDEKADNLK